MSAVTSIDVPVRRAGRRRLRLPANVSLRIGLGILLLLALLGFAGSALLEDPTRQDLTHANAPPGSPGALLGTDPLGRDVLAWTAGGVRVGMLVATAVVVIACCTGVLLGLLAGYLGSVWDSLLMRLADLFLAVPPILLFLAASAVIGSAILPLIVLISAVAWVPYARTVRAIVRSERGRAHVSAARLAGAGHLRVMVVHLLPSAATVILVIASLQLGYVLLWESALSFLGLGIRPPHTSLGFIISEGRDALLANWWIVVVPGVALTLLVIAANLIGDGLRDLFQLDSSTGGMSR